jgi:hypothetical protein
MASQVRFPFRPVPANMNENPASLPPLIPCVRPLHPLLDEMLLAVTLSAPSSSAFRNLRSSRQSDGVTRTMAEVCEACCVLCIGGCECVCDVLNCLVSTGGECLECASHACSSCVDCCACLYTAPRNLSKCCCDCDCRGLRGRGKHNRNRGGVYRRQPSRASVSIPPPVAVPVVFVTAKVQPEGPTSPPPARWGS